MEGNDLLISHGGRDKLYGGSGDDTFIVTPRLDVVKIFGDDGYDVLELHGFDEATTEIREFPNKTVLLDENDQRIVIRGVESFDFL